MELTKENLLWIRLVLQCYIDLNERMLSAYKDKDSVDLLNYQINRSRALLIKVNNLIRSY